MFSSIGGTLGLCCGLSILRCSIVLVIASYSLLCSIVQFIELFFLCFCPRLSKRGSNVKPNNEREMDVNPYSHSPNHYPAPLPLAGSSW